MRVTNCRSCQASIVWLPTRTGARMPVDVDGVLEDDTEFDAARHKSHFATCPQAEQHRKARNGRGR